MGVSGVGRFDVPAEDANCCGGLRGGVTGEDRYPQKPMKKMSPLATIALAVVAATLLALAATNGLLSGA